MKADKLNDSSPPRSAPAEATLNRGSGAEGDAVREKITRSEIGSAINRSGYLLEQRVSSFFESNGFHVETNPAFRDEITSKSREYDASAFIVFDLLGRPRSVDHYGLHILCECENNEQPVVFFTSNFYAQHLFYEGIQHSGLPLSLSQKGRRVPLSQALEFETFHHYWKWPIATQYCSFHRKNRSSPWIASHAEDHHNTFAALMGAVENSIDEHYRLLTTWLPLKSAQVRAHYPLLVLGGEICLAEESDDGELQITEAEFVQFRREMWLGAERRIHHIDVIRESFLPKYVEMILDEIDEVRTRSAKKKKQIIAALFADLRRFSAAKHIQDMRRFFERE